jgi:hypothetical protein
LQDEGKDERAGYSQPEPKVSPRPKVAHWILGGGDRLRRGNNARRLMQMKYSRVTAATQEYGGKGLRSRYSRSALRLPGWGIEMEL